MILLLKKSVGVLFSFLLICSLILPFSAPTFSDDQPLDLAYDEFSNPYVSSQLIVVYNKSTPADSKRSLRAQMQLELKAELKSINAEVLKVKPEDSKSTIDNLKRNKDVLFAEYDYITQIDFTPNDPNYVNQVYLPLMKVPSAWDTTMGDGSVLVAVLDTGLNTANTDLSGINVTGYNVLTSSTNFSDDNGHGTMVTSVLAAKTNNSFGIAGLIPNARFLAVKVMSSTGTGTYSDMIKGIEYASSQGAKVINMSIGGRSASSALKLAVDTAVANGITIVSATGNEGTTTLNYPAAYDNVIGVGAVDTQNNKMSYSNTGSGLTVMAGGTARVATSTDYITNASGTSFASPYVAGLIGMMYAADPTMTASKAIEILSQTSVDLGPSGYDTTFGYGLIDMETAVLMASGKTLATAVDLLPPVVTLNGETTIKLPINSEYTEPGYTALDETDGDITNLVQINSNLDVTKVGYYELVYTAVDKAGNISNIATRSVEIYDNTVVETTASTEASTESTTFIEITTEAETVILEPEIKIVRDVEVVEGTLNKKVPIATHIINVLTPGKLDIALTYKSKTPPTVTITGLNFSGTGGTYDVQPGEYVMTISTDGTLSFSATITYPEREVAVDVPLGEAEVIQYGAQSNLLWYIYLAVTLFIFAAFWVMYQKGTIEIHRNN